MGQPRDEKRVNDHSHSCQCDLREGPSASAFLSSLQIELPEPQWEACQRTATLAPVSWSRGQWGLHSIPLLLLQRCIRKITPGVIDPSKLGSPSNGQREPWHFLLVLLTQNRPM